MNRKVLTGIAAGLLTAAVLAMVAIGGYRAGERHDRTITVVGETSSEGRTVVVPADRWDGPGPGAFLFPVVVIGLVVLAVSRPRRHWGYYRYGPANGWGAPACDPRSDTDLRDWHRRQHDESGTTPTDSTD